MLQLILNLTKGIIRDRKARRTTMLYLIGIATVMLFSGSAFISNDWMRRNPWLGIGYWLVCAWFTLAAVLLALLDILVIRAETRVRQRMLEKEMLEEARKKNE